MTTYVEARDALVFHLNTAWPAAYPTVPIYYENTLHVDLDSVGDAFVRAEVTFSDAVQASVETNPLTRVQGALYLVLMTREGLGTRTMLGYMDYLTGLFKYRTLNGVQTGAPAPMRTLMKDGWYYQELAVPFWFDNA